MINSVYTKSLKGIDGTIATTIIDGVKIEGTLSAKYTIDLEYNKKADMTVYSADAMVMVYDKDGKFVKEEKFSTLEQTQSGRLTVENVKDKLVLELNNKIENKFEIVQEAENEP